MSPKFSWVLIHSTQVVLLYPHDASLNKQQTNCCHASHPSYKSFMNEKSETERFSSGNFLLWMKRSNKFLMGIPENGVWRLSRISKNDD